MRSGSTTSCQVPKLTVTPLRPMPGYWVLCMPWRLHGLDIPPPPELNSSKSCLSTVQPLLKPKAVDTVCPDHPGGCVWGCVCVSSTQLIQTQQMVFLNTGGFTCSPLFPQLHQYWHNAILQQLIFTPLTSLSPCTCARTFQGNTPVLAASQA